MNSQFKRILCCTDFSEGSQKVFSAALGMARLHEDSVLVLFHVIPEPDAQFWKTYIYELDRVDEKAKADIDRRFAEEYIALIEPALLPRVRIKVAVGSARNELMSAIRDENIDLLVIGRPVKKGGFWHTDGAKEALRIAPCAVLGIPLE